MKKIIGAGFYHFIMHIGFFLLKLINEVGLLINPKKYHILALYQ
jgi:hypothetical protein